MGSVQGDLDLFGIDIVLQAVADRKLSGFLEIRRDSKMKVLEFSPGRIRLVSGAQRRRPLGEILVRAGKITVAQLEALLREQQDKGVPLGEILADRGIVSRDHVESALRKQVAEEIHELFGWTGAAFRFFSAGTEPAPADDGPLAAIWIDTSVMTLMLEAARRIDEIEQIRSVIPDERLIPELLALPTILEDPGLDRPVVEELVPLIDGEHSVEDLMGASIYPEYTVLRALYGMAQGGFLKIRDRRNREEDPVTVLGRRRGSVADRSLSQGRSVLVLGDDPTFREGISHWIKREGFGAIESGMAGDLERIAAAGRVDAIILDLALGTPEADEVGPRIGRHFLAPVMVLSSGRGREALAQALGSGFRQVLLKPIEPELLLDRLYGILSARS